jgi:hypothetical protein
MFIKFILFYLSIVNAKIIKNINIPSCRNCIYYKPPIYTDFNSHISKCEYIGTKNIQTDVIVYDYADLCRNDENKCGINGKYFKKEPNIELKILLHNIINTFPLNVSLIFIIIKIYNGQLK